VLPLQFADGDSAAALGLAGLETFTIAGIAEAVDGAAAGAQTVHVTAAREDGSETAFDARLRIDTPREADYFRHGGILQYVLRALLKS